MRHGGETSWLCPSLQNRQRPWSSSSSEAQTPATFEFRTHTTLLTDPATDIPKRRHTIKNHTDTRSFASGPHTHLHHPPPDIMRHTASWRSPKASASACMTLSTDPVAHHTIVRNFHGRDGPATPLNPLKAIRRRPSMRAGVPAACMHLDSV